MLSVEDAILAGLLRDDSALNMGKQAVEGLLLMLP